MRTAGNEGRTYSRQEGAPGRTRGFSCFAAPPITEPKSKLARWAQTMDFGSALCSQNCENLPTVLPRSPFPRRPIDASPLAEPPFCGASRLRLLLSAAQKPPPLASLPPPATLICRAEASPPAEPPRSHTFVLPRRSFLPSRRVLISSVPLPPCRSFLPSRGAFLLQLRLYAAERAVVLHAGTRQAFCRFASIARAGNPLSEPYGRVRISRAS